jgi:hypothetical protein
MIVMRAGRQVAFAVRPGVPLVESEATVAGRKFGIATYYIGDGGSFDTAIAQLMPQIEAGLGVNIRRLDGIQVRVTNGPGWPPVATEAPYWRAHSSLHCDLCETGWKGGYFGMDAAGAIQTSICHDCADNLLRMQLGVTRLVMS